MDIDPLWTSPNNFKPNGRSSDCLRGCQCLRGWDGARNRLNYRTRVGSRNQCRVVLPQIVLCPVAVITYSPYYQVTDFCVPSGICNSRTLHLDRTHFKLISQFVSLPSYFQHLIARGNWAMEDMRFANT